MHYVNMHHIKIGNKNAYGFEVAEEKIRRKEVLREFVVNFQQ